MIKVDPFSDYFLLLRVLTSICFLSHRSCIIFHDNRDRCFLHRLSLLWGDTGREMWPPYQGLKTTEQALSELDEDLSFQGFFHHKLKHSNSVPPVVILASVIRITSKICSAWCQLNLYQLLALTLLFTFKCWMVISINILVWNENTGNTGQDSS